MVGPAAAVDTGGPEPLEQAGTAVAGPPVAQLAGTALAAAAVGAGEVALPPGLQSSWTAVRLQS